MKVALTIIGVVLGLIALAVLAIMTFPFKGNDDNGAVITALIALQKALKGKLLPTKDDVVVVPDAA